MLFTLKRYPDSDRSVQKFLDSLNCMKALYNMNSIPWKHPRAKNCGCCCEKLSRGKSKAAAVSACVISFPAAAVTTKARDSFTKGRGHAQLDGISSNSSPEEKKTRLCLI